MAEVTPEVLKDAVTEILKGADLATTSRKNVRKQLEEKFDCDLNSRKDEINQIIMADIENKKANDVSEEEEESSEEEEAPAKKRAAPKRKGGSDESDEFVPNEDDEDYEPRKPKAKPKPKKQKKKQDDDDDQSDEDWGKPKKQKKKAGGGGGRKSTAFTRSFKLSDELADVVGGNVMPRHEVVKKLWAVIKERNLQDPKNKQFAICDDQLLKVMGVKRFRTFGMMKHLKTHFLEAV